MKNLTTEEREFLIFNLKNSLETYEFRLKLGVKSKSKHSIKSIPLTPWEIKRLEIQISSFKKLLKSI